jgi:FAD:protein FMN transferase
MICRLICCAAGCLLAATCSFAVEPLIIAGPTMGTTYRVKVVDADDADPASLRTEIETILADVDRRLSTYRQDSEISHFNRAAVGKWFNVSPATAKIVAAAKEFNHHSGGALDITVGPLVRLWHFGPDTLASAKSPVDITPPTEAELRTARALVGDDKLEVRLNPPAMRKQVVGLEIDLSSIGEGHAIDLISSAISKRAHKNFLIELGGEIRTSGNGPRRKPWRIAVQRPDDSRSRAQQMIELPNAAVATSGDYHRYFEHNGRRYSHIIDPTTGRPIEHKLAAVTVAAEDALTADVWDTALLVLGPERGYDAAVEHDVAALFIARDGDRFTARETPAWRKRFAAAEGH